MNLQEYDFPVSPRLSVDFNLLEESKRRGFYCGNTKYNNLFSELFFSGGKLNFKKNLPESFKTNATIYLKSFMQSFIPKHEEKESICAMLLSELVELEEEK